LERADQHPITWEEKWGREVREVSACVKGGRVGRRGKKPSLGSRERRGRGASAIILQVGLKRDAEAPQSDSTVAVEKSKKKEAGRPVCPPKKGPLLLSYWNQEAQPCPGTRGHEREGSVQFGTQGKGDVVKKDGLWSKRREGREGQSWSRSKPAAGGRTAGLLEKRRSGTE